jgi:menaquinone-dependent protoporphyrinogen oxidase
MSTKVLVAYATRYGSTREVAESVAATLAERGLDTALARTPWLAPVSAELFVGKYDPARLNLGDKLIARLPVSPLHDMPAQDARDWPGIKGWAEGIAATILQGWTG